MIHAYHCVDCGILQTKRNNTCFKCGKECEEVVAGAWNTKASAPKDGRIFFAAKPSVRPIPCAWRKPSGMTADFYRMDGAVFTPYNFVHWIDYPPAPRYE